MKPLNKLESYYYLWIDSQISQQKKVYSFQILIMSKLLYIKQGINLVYINIMANIDREKDNYQYIANPHQQPSSTIQIGRVSTPYNILMFITLITLLIYSIWTYHSMQFKSQALLQQLKLWEQQKIIDKQKESISKLLNNIQRVLDDYKKQLVVQKHLMFKIQQKYIDNLNDEQNIPQIVQFKTEHKTQEEQYHYFVATVTELTDKFKKTQARQNKIKMLNNVTQMMLLAESLKQIRNQIKLLYQDISQKYSHNHRWFSQKKEEYQQVGDQKQNKRQNLKQLDGNSYQTIEKLPILAREILTLLPIEFIEIIYKNQKYGLQEAMAKKRDRIYLQRSDIAHQNRNIWSLSMMIYNLSPLNQPKRLYRDIRDQYNRLNALYNLQGFKQEIGMCIVVPTYNNNVNFRIQLNLNSIFMQNYTNYKVVIIDDASNDETPLIIERYLSFFNINGNKAELIVNQNNQKALSNIYHASLNNCKGYEVVVLIDGDDELIGFNVLKVLNSRYQSSKLGVLYSNYVDIEYKLKYVHKGTAEDYTEEEKKQQKYRQSPQKFSHLITFKRELIQQIKKQDLMNFKGFYKSAYDFALVYPLMQLSCSHVGWIDQFQYLYNKQTGYNDHRLVPHLQYSARNDILKNQPYECSQKYK